MALRILARLSGKPNRQLYLSTSSNYSGMVISSFDGSKGHVSRSPVSCHCLVTKTVHRRPTCEFSTTSSVWSEKYIGQSYEDGRLIYIGSKGQRIKLIQAILYSVGGTLMLACPLLLNRLTEHRYMQYAFAAWITMFGFGNPYLFYKFANRYVLEIYHDKENDKYTVYTISPFIFDSRKMPAAPTPFTSFVVDKKPLLVSSDEMSYLQYSRMLRYASEFDYENPERQSQYNDAVQESIQRITKPNKESEKNTDVRHEEAVSSAKSDNKEK